jgi:hypothetical protein
MRRFVIPGLCGFAGAAVALAAAVLLLRRTLGTSDFLTVSRGPGPEYYQDVAVLEHARRPQGLYVRFKNTGRKAIEMAHFKVRAYKDGKLWAEFEEGHYSETKPGEEQEGILKLRDYRDGGKTYDLSDCRIEVIFLYGYVVSHGRA